MLVDFRDMVDNKINELDGMKVEDPNFAKSAEAIAKLLKAEADIGDLSDRYVLDEQIRKEELAIKEDQAKTEKKTLWARVAIAGVEVIGGFIACMTVLGIDTQSQNILSKTGRKILETKFGKWNV